MPDLLGSTLGPYRILEQIGLGGMATVYKAYQPGMDRLVALKVLPQHYARDPRFIKRFEQEAKVIAKLEQRSVVRSSGIAVNTIGPRNMGRKLRQ
ncbi:hypothetical protein FJY94_04480 [Candidatus Kaiserbacteria bacterium]|nr:hypothetical protein [Candidatus Kaiserbacteria bacterium]